jgi:hypothetical protein
MTDIEKIVNAVIRNINAKFKKDDEPIFDSFTVESLKKNLLAEIRDSIEEIENEKRSNHNFQEMGEATGRMIKSIEILKSFFGIEELFLVTYTDVFRRDFSDESKDVLTIKEVKEIIKKENFEYEFEFPAVKEIKTFTSGISDGEMMVRITIERIV